MCKFETCHTHGKSGFLKNPIPRENKISHRERWGCFPTGFFFFWNSIFFLFLGFTCIWKPVCLPRNLGENKIWGFFDDVKGFQIRSCLSFTLGFLGNQTGSRGYYRNLHYLLKFTECKGRAWNQGITYTRGELLIFMLIMVIIFSFLFLFLFLNFWIY